ncbi:MULTISPECIES: methionine--tRNA ligase [unclassified Bradyrhizobium]|uniref:methionine--tRNA ligase n=1 Tax=unclassified Bradyrhizobium TaxID=2631580 RepID=UPI0011439296|nr:MULTISPECIES: methionine--tRNA ligase [unclassified Bradyrhizobium]MCP1851989.1 methionyl-tRNA synthetase [Bradyrhizobium sp. USDA 4541]MCP1915876.1 methionyl-tRNA synthetase [Bradyrhizobium elkanii]
MATAKKKSSKKAKKTKKASPARATSKATAKARAAKKAGRVAKKAKKAAKSKSKTGAKGARKSAAKKVVKKAVKKAAKQTAKSTAKKAAAKATKAAPKKAAAAAAAPAAKKPALPMAPVTEKAQRPAKVRAPKQPKPAAVAPAAASVPVPAADRGNVFYITTAIAYPNGQPHIGHAYEAIATDALARFQRLDGKDVFFLTGTDEHGQKMIQTAAGEGMTPFDLATRNAARFKEMDERLNVSFDRFIRTSEPAHHKSVQEIWRRMQDNGDIYIDTYAGWYSVRDEAYYAEEETVVGEDNVRRGPQGTPVEWVEEKSYFFKLSAYQDKLLHLYESQPDFIGPDSRRNEVMSFVRGGLKDLSISRTTFDWGVKVPDDPEHVMYVWVDALTNYITGVGYPDENDKHWRYWPADVHIIGKDIIRFHAVYWPAFLMSAGIPVQKRVYAHGFLFNRGEKMSKSVGNVVDPFNLAEQYGVDQMRYFFLREVPFGQDGNYNHEAIVARINADLANDFGNLAQRSLSMIAKQLGGVLPEPGEFSDNDKAILAQADAMLETSRTAMATQQIHQWLNTVWAVVAEANRYFAGEAPWALAKTDPARQKTVLYVTAEVVRQIAIMAQAVMPESCGKMLDSLGIAADARSFAAVAERIKPGTVLPAPVGVFPRYVEPKTE